MDLNFDLDVVVVVDFVNGHFCFDLVVVAVASSLNHH
jgi:hypothetical protein